MCYLTNIVLLSVTFSEKYLFSVLCLTHCQILGGGDMRHTVKSCMRSVKRLNPHVDVFHLIRLIISRDQKKQTKFRCLLCTELQSQNPIIVLNGEVDVNHLQNRQHIFLRVTDTSSLK